HGSESATRHAANDDRVPKTACWVSSATHARKSRPDSPRSPHEGPRLVRVSAPVRLPHDGPVPAARTPPGRLSPGLRPSATEMLPRGTPGGLPISGDLSGIRSCSVTALHDHEERYR